MFDFTKMTYISIEISIGHLQNKNVTLKHTIKA